MEKDKIMQYLENNGWKPFPRQRQDIKVFQKETGEGFFQVTIPLDPDLSDYNDAMAEAIRTIAFADDVSEEEIELG